MLDVPKLALKITSNGNIIDDVCMFLIFIFDLDLSKFNDVGGYVDIVS